MEQKKKQTGRSRLLIPILYLALAGAGAYYTAGHAILYRNEKAFLAEKFDFKKRLLDVNEWLGESEGPQGGEMILETAQNHYGQSVKWGLALLGLSAAFLFITWRLPRLAPGRPPALIAVALVCLCTGLFTPLMEIAAYERNLEIPLQIKTGLFSLNLDYTQTFEGDLYFYYQSKSVVELIGLLLRQHNFVVGLSILLFSILIPLSKLLLSGSVWWRPGLWEVRWICWVLEKTGKWSMADVFVVALFLGYLAFDNMQTGIRTDSRVLPGLYFFLAYCLLAILLPRHLHKAQGPKDSAAGK